MKSRRGKSSLQLQNLVRIITELVVKQATHKAIRKITNLAAAIFSIKTLKGIGPFYAFCCRASCTSVHSWLSLLLYYSSSMELLIC